MPTLFNRLFPPKKRITAKAIEIGVLHDLLRESAPAAAYLFSWSLRDMRAMVVDRTVPTSEKIHFLTNALAAARGQHNADAGMTCHAYRFAMFFVSAESMKIGEAHIAINLVYARMAQFGEHYRELESRDELPPNTPEVAEVLRRGDNKCVANAIRKVRHEGAAEEEAQLLLAFFDIRDEGASGRLGPLMAHLDSALANLPVT